MQTSTAYFLGTLLLLTNKKRTFSLTRCVRTRKVVNNLLPPVASDADADALIA